MPIKGGRSRANVSKLRMRVSSGKLKVESCIKTISSCNYRFAVITRNVSDEVIHCFSTCCNLRLDVILPVL